MPSSRPEPLPYICNRIIQIKPKSILDIGIGFGKYGFLAREYTDVWRTNAEGYWNWKTLIDGIEIYERYITDLQRIIYNNIYIGNALDIIPENNLYYDLIIMSDVLEHFSKEDGEKVLAVIKKYGNTGLIVTPVNVLPQGAVYNNRFESHISKWNETELKQWGKVIKTGNAYILDMQEE